MAKLQVSDWDVVAANNTDINSIPIDGAVTTPSQVDNINREMMAQIKAFSLTVTISVGVSVDNTVPRFNGTAGALQGSTAVIGDDGSLTITGTGDTNKLGFFHVLNPSGTSDGRYTSIVVGKAASSNESMHFGYYYDTTTGDRGGYICNYGNSELTNSIFIRWNGNVGIGTATPTRKLDVVGDFNASTGISLNGKSIATDAMSGFIGAPANKTYTVSLKCPFGGTINETVTICASGTCTATFKINGTPLGGTANSVSSSEQTQAQASANTFAAGDDIAVTISSNSSCVDMSFTIKVTKAF
jgi:hypothetical protein